VKEEGGARIWEDGGGEVMEKLRREGGGKCGEAGGLGVL